MAETRHLRLGSVRSATGSGGGLEDRYEYDAFGKPYTGKPYDTAIGLYNYGCRDYQPAAARFTTIDPARDGSNWFAYVNNDPVNWVDPWGLQCIGASDIQSKVTVALIGTTITPLSTLVNTDNLAAIITANSQYLDPVTANYVNNKTAQGVADDLNKINVVTGADKAAVMAIASQYNVPSTVDALTVGNTIFVFGPIPTDSNGRINDQGRANLYGGHEPIHSLQVNAEGELSNFLNAYSSSGVYANEKEQAAYNFGGYDPGISPQTTSGQAVLDDYPEWQR